MTSVLNSMKYLTTLPDEVLINGQFCVTRVGDKQPYDPFKREFVSAKDKFYPIDEILSLEDEGLYDTLGIKVANGISAIDIDGCVDSNGSINKVASEIIQFMKSYTELSPSKTGIRILFKAANEYDFNKHKTKDSINGLEYYDADYQETKGGRMVRLTGDKIMPFDFREVNTEYILDKYMLRNHIGDVDLVSEPADPDWVELVYVLMAIRTDMKNLYNREVFDNYESESDLIICNTIAEYTSNVNEIMDVFRKLRYYKTKGIRSGKRTHKTKWDSQYGINVVNMAVPKETKLEYKPRDNKPVSTIIKIVSAIRYGFLKPFYFRKHDIDWDMEIDGEELVRALYLLADMRIARKNLKNELLNELEGIASEEK